MNRRSFVATLLAGVVAPLILPGAGRKWKKVEDLYVPNPNWVNAPYEQEIILFGSDGKQYNFGPSSDVPGVWFNKRIKTWYQKDNRGVYVPMDNLLLT